MPVLIGFVLRTSLECDADMTLAYDIRKPPEGGSRPVHRSYPWWVAGPDFPDAFSLPNLRGPVIGSSHATLSAHADVSWQDSSTRGFHSPNDFESPTGSSGRCQDVAYK